MPRQLRFLARVANAAMAQSAEVGALPLLYAATYPDLPGGSYVGPDGPAEMRGYPTLVQPSDRAINVEDARRLWQISEKLTGVRYEELEPTASGGKS